MPSKILVTGAAGFIGNEVCLTLLEQGHFVVGIDNINDYYDISLKNDRLKRLTHSSFLFQKCDIQDKISLEKLFAKHRFDRVIHMAAQAGVRYSLENPQAYIDTNITGFLNILECVKNFKVHHTVYASSSSVYGRNSSVPFKVTDTTEKPSSLYATTKKTNELMAETYHHLYGLNLTGLRFFTVYGPWGRPDMAPCLFAKAITTGQAIQIFNNGNMKRDFTYISDIVQGVVQTSYVGSLKTSPEHSIYNIGHGTPIDLMHFIECLEDYLGEKAIKNYMPMQAGDVEITWADTSDLEAAIAYKPKVSVEEGVSHFVTWFKKYYSKSPHF